MDQTILTTSARLDDDAGMLKFLSPIPNGDQLATLFEHRKPVSTRAYDDESFTARFVLSDGITAMCFTVPNVTIDQAEMIAAQCEGRHAWGSDAFEEAVAVALEGTLEPPE
jgi:hypothetical protein